VFLCEFLKVKRMVKAELATVGLYVLASLLVWTAFYAWSWWTTGGTQKKDM
jgi:hypothetical protein